MLWKAPASSTAKSLINSRFERESCGVGFVATQHSSPSHDILKLALTALGRLAHRGAVSGDGRSSDGVGILTAVPREFLLQQASVRLADRKPLAVGMLFLPQDSLEAEENQRGFEQCLQDRGLEFLGWRDVPLNTDVLGPIALGTMPAVRQALITSDNARVSVAELERELFLARKAFERLRTRAYVCSLSSRTLVYKAMCLGKALHEFYPDLQHPAFLTSFAVFHQRYATNVLPSWDRAQPCRMIAHNGEINTIWSNRAHMEARRALLPPECEPILSPDASDSISLDEVAELLSNHGRNIAESVRMLLPAAGDREESAFHRYHSDCMEPWDGPSALVFTDGHLLGAVVDRNGLRPCRYVIRDDGLIVAGSEFGLAEIHRDAIIRSGRLGPGQMILLDLDHGKLLEGAELDHYFDAVAPYATLIDDVPLNDSEEQVPALDVEDLFRLQQGFGYSREEVKMMITPMAQEGKEAIWSMGDDTPLAPLARTPRPLYNYFRQRFAQVTNPPIDPLRESNVLSLRTRLGPWPHLLDKLAPLPGLVLDSPFLSLRQMAALRTEAYPLLNELPMSLIDCTYAHQDSLHHVLSLVCKLAIEMVEKGTRILVLSDRHASEQRLPIPMALLTGAVHHALVKSGLRTKVGLALEAGDCRDVHHAAVLIGYGAGAVCPWLMLQTARALGGNEGERRVLKAMNSGIAKVMSKMGISVLDSYRAAQLFDIIGLNEDVIKRCFSGSESALGGIGFAEIDDGLRNSWGIARQAELPDHGWVRFRRDDRAELHAWAPQRVRDLQAAVGVAKSSAATAVVDSTLAWRAYIRDEHEPEMIRDLLQVQPAGPPLEIANVEPVSSLVRRFVSSAMSLGSLSPEAHQTITEGMNLLGARSNTGEGGEDAAAYVASGDTSAPRRLNNKIKQIASGRFGVTTEYLAHAEELEIKIAQGSKPGEGGQLPGHKVSELIARLRHSQPGVTLISPPPHHDIYSIEDLAQLIYDLKRVNPRAAIGVKLVAQLGVGTVAAGVAKAYADYIHISGHSGGTGASPLSSIKNAGSPWELGLAEAQQVLRHNGLRERVRLRVDGGLTTAHDVLIAALLGAEEFAFGTAVLVALGCDMARQCHLNTCPTGIATQRPELRAKFRGKPEHVMRLLTNLAEDLQRLLAEYGLPSLEAAVGRVDLLEQVRGHRKLDLTAMLAKEGEGPLHWLGQRNCRPEERPPVDDAWLRPALSAVKAGRPFEYKGNVNNGDRTLGARLAGELALLRTASPGLQPDVHFRLHGTAGQSFGAFACEGMYLRLEGHANDFVGKGLSGGELVITRPEGKLAHSEAPQVILGNVALYGATAGTLLAAGGAGERFAIRNSGATAVVEGIGDHGCEYMTGGVVVVLGPTGTNFGAGMTGGVAFVWDPSGAFLSERKYNAEFVAPEVLEECDVIEQEAVRSLLAKHAQQTRSTVAKRLYAGWPIALQQILRVAPRLATAM